MGQILGPDNIPTIVVASTTTVTLAATNNGSATTITIGGQQYALSSQLTLNAATTGANGLDTGSLTSNGTYYVYAIVNSTSFAVALIGSTSNASVGPAIPSGYSTAFKEVGVFNTNGSSQVSTTASTPLGPQSWLNSTGTLQIGNITNNGAWQLGPNSSSFTQTSATISARISSTVYNLGNSFEWGHNNQSGYASVLGYNTGGGQPFIGFSCEAGSTANTFRTRGNAGNLIMGGGTVGGLFFGYISNSNADNQSSVQHGFIDTLGQWTIGPTVASAQTHTVNATIVNVASNNTNFDTALNVTAHVNRRANFTLERGGTADIVFQATGISAQGYNTMGGGIPNAGDVGILLQGNGNKLTFSTNGNTPIAEASGSGSWTFGPTSGSSVAHSLQGVMTQTNNGVVYAKNLDTTTSSDNSFALRCIKGSSTNTQKFISFEISSGSTGNGQIAGNGANVAAFFSFSDRRLKTNVVPLNDMLSKVASLNPVEFDYIGDEENKIAPGHQTGFIAQEVQAIFPDSVYEDVNGYLMLAGWSKVEAILVKAIQELKAENDTLKARLDGYGIP